MSARPYGPGCMMEKWVQDAEEGMGSCCHQGVSENIEIKCGAFKSYRRLDKKSNVDGGVQAGSQIFRFFTCAQKFRSLWRADQITLVQVSIATELAPFYPPNLSLP